MQILPATGSPPDVAGWNPHCRTTSSAASIVWKKRLRKSATTKFLEVRVQEPASSPSDPRVEVRLQNGRSLMVGREFDAEHVRALLTVMESAE